MAYSDPRLAQADAYLGASRPQQALDLAGRALTEEPDSRDAAAIVVRALLNLDRNRDARRAAEQMLGAHPNDEQAWRLHALACAKLENWADAWRSSRRAISLAPQEWRTHYVAGQIDLEAKSVSPDTWTQINEAVRLAPDEPATHYLAGLAALNQKDLNLAEQAFTEVLRLDPEHANARNNLAVVALRRGKSVPAAAGFADSLSADPTNTTAARNLDITITRATWWLQYGICLCAFLGARSATASNSAVVHALPAIFAVVIILIATISWMPKMLGGSHNLRRYLRTMPRRRPLLAAQLAISALVVVALIVAAIIAGVVAPSGIAVMAAFIAAMVLAVAGVICAFVDRSRRQAATGRSARR
ncbi:MAG: tetratricopeptide repeat protein [Micrococcales bacterium]|nr:tetratricopeptide repeat protein [Micrococcales bacterium]